MRDEFADPALEGLTANQKMLLRVGSAQQRPLKAVLASLHRELVAAASAR